MGKEPGWGRRIQIENFDVACGYSQHGDARGLRMKLQHPGRELRLQTLQLLLGGKIINHDLAVLQAHGEPPAVGTEVKSPSVDLYRQVSQDLAAGEIPDLQGVIGPVFDRQ